MKNPKYTDAAKHPNKVKAAVESIKCSTDLLHFLTDLAFFLEERGDSLKLEETRDEELIELIEYCTKQAEITAKAVHWRNSTLRR